MNQMDGVLATLTDTHSKASHSTGPSHSTSSQLPWKTTITWAKLDPPWIRLLAKSTGSKTAYTLWPANDRMSIRRYGKTKTGRSLRWRNCIMS